MGHHDAPSPQLWYCYFDISTELVFPSDFRQIVQAQVQGRRDS